jgi:hypothetical protein
VMPNVACMVGETAAGKFLSVHDYRTPSPASCCCYEVESYSDDKRKLQYGVLIDVLVPAICTW